MPEQASSAAAPAEKDADQPKWFYALDGQRLGPVGEDEMRALITQGKIDRETSVWREGTPDWIPLDKTSLAQHVMGPPPLTGAHVSNTVAWLIALAPLVGGIIELIVRKTARVGGGETWFITVGLQIGLICWDWRRLKKAGHKDLRGWFVWIFPVYLWKRAGVLKQKRTYFWAWVLFFVLSWLILMLGAQGNPANNEELSQLKKCSIVYVTNAGLANTGLTFGKLLDSPNVSNKKPKITKSDPNLVHLVMETPKGQVVITFAWDQGLSALVATGVALGGEETTDTGAIMLVLAGLSAQGNSLETNADALEAKAVGSCQAYAWAQTIFKPNDWDGDGVFSYAKDFKELSTTKDGTGRPINLIDAAFAVASGPASPKHGYYFVNMKTIGGKAIDWKNEFALCAVPAVYGKPGRRTFIISTNGTTFGKDTGGKPVKDYPADPQKDGWLVAE